MTHVLANEIALTLVEKNQHSRRSGLAVLIYKMSKRGLDKRERKEFVRLLG